MFQLFQTHYAHSTSTLIKDICGRVFIFFFFINKNKMTFNELFIVLTKWNWFSSIFLCVSPLFLFILFFLLIPICFYIDFSSTTTSTSLLSHALVSVFVCPFYLILRLMISSYNKTIQPLTILWLQSSFFLFFFIVYLLGVLYHSHKIHNLLWTLQALMRGQLKR